MMNGAFFVESGNPEYEFIKGPDMIHPRPGSDVSRLTRFSGSLNFLILIDSPTRSSSQKRCLKFHQFGEL